MKGNFLLLPTRDSWEELKSRSLSSEREWEPPDEECVPAQAQPSPGPAAPMEQGLSHLVRPCLQMKYKMGSVLRIFWGSVPSIKIKNRKKNK